jgi:hypothetical protein
MTPVFGSRRRADELEQLLSRSSAATAAGDGPEQYADLLALVGALRATPAPAPRAAFSSDLRERLMVAAESALAPDPVEQGAPRRQPTARRSPRERRLATAVGGFAIVSATASMAVAAQSSLPGDTLYPLKRAIENAQTGVQSDADGRGTSLLDNAAGRLDEVDALSRSGEDDAEVIVTTLEDFVAQASEASDLLLGDFSSTGEPSSIEELRSFTADSMGALTTLQGIIPDDARASLISATQIVNAIDVQAQALCPACTDLPLIEAPVFATRAAASLLDDALAPVLDAVLPPVADEGAADEETRKGPRKPARDTEPRSGASGLPEPAPAPDQPAPTTPPVAPSLPTDTSDGGDEKDGDKKGGLLDLGVKGSDDPVGDLLTGTGEVVEGVVEGVVTGLGGLTGLGGSGGGRGK